MTIENNDNENYYVDLTISCTIENAVRQLLGISLPIRDGLSESSDYDTLESALSTIKEYAEVDYSNAKFEKEPEDIIAIRLEKLNKVELLIDKARLYKSDINDELGRGSNSDLKRDTDEEKISKSNYILITNSSLKKWALKQYGISLSENSAKLNPLEQSEKPWLIQEPNDPPPIQPWYIPARYFARQLIIRDPSLTKKKNILVDKIVQELTKVGIYKRGEKKEFNPDTIKKALSNVKYK